MNYLTLTFIVTVIVLLTGLFIISAGVFLLFKEKILLNAQGNVTHVEIPWMGKIKTNYPSVVAIFVGAAISIAVLMKWSVPEAEGEKMPISATVTIDGSSPREVFVAAIPGRYRTTRNQIQPNSPEEIVLWVDRATSYDVLVYTIVHTHPDGRSQRAVEHGGVRIVEGETGLEGKFEASLKVP